MSNIKWLFAWADSNGVEIPIDSSGAANIPKLLELYNRANGGTGRQKTERLDEKNDTPATETVDNKASNAKEEANGLADELVDNENEIVNIITGQDGVVDYNTFTQAEWHSFYDEAQKTFVNDDYSYVDKNNCEPIVISSNNRHFLILSYGTFDKPKIDEVYQFNDEDSLYDYSNKWSKR